MIRGFKCRKKLVIMVSSISQLSVLASHKTNFESVAQRCLGIRHVAIWEVLFLSDPCVFGYIFQEKVPIETFYTSS